ncbi:MAG: ABC transporter ATP-binding protein [Armatimonadota bacterium]|nr:ABC transporter ATP-binding protein [Armatimonadota bacterium]
MSDPSKQERKVSPQKRVASYILRYKKVFIGGALCGAGSAVVMMLVTWLIKLFFDAMEMDKGHGGHHLLMMVCVGTIGCYVLNWVFSYGQTYLLSFGSNRVAADLRNDIYSHIQSLPLSFFDRTRTGHIISRIANDIGLIQNGSNVIVPLVRAPLIIVVGLGIMFLTSWKLSLIAAIVAPLMALTITKIGRKMKTLTSLLQITLADLTAALEDAMVGMRVIKSFGTEDYEIDKFAEHNRRSLRATMRGVKRNAAVTPTLEFLGALGAVGVIYYGASLVQQPHSPMTVGSLVQYFALLNLVQASARQFGQVTVTYQQTMAGAERVFEMIDEKSDLVEAPDAITLPTVCGRVEFRDVTFEYKKGIPVLRNVSFTMEPGKVVALVGPSGAGKSTIAYLIPRFYDVLDGAVLVDGVDVREVTLNSLRKHIGIVPQETILFTGTVRENISYGRFDATDEEVIEAAKAARAHEFIAQLKEGYNTIVGERGVALSGGERQRISIARALLRNPRILILDEATSSLDSTSESLVQEALERLMQGRTTLVIAHRLSTITKADHILAIRDGRVAESGTFRELLAAGGLFHSLYNTQFRPEQTGLAVD